ncbi:Ribonuclease H1 N-terminal domain-containing protein, partial [Dysosmobacter welbionis]
DLEVVVLCGQGDGHTALQLDQRLIQAEGRGGDDDLVPWVQDGGEGGEQRLRGAHRQDDLTGGVVEAMGLSLEFGDGLQRVGIAVAGGIVGIVGVQSGLGGLLDDVGGVQ